MLITACDVRKLRPAEVKYLIHSHRLEHGGTKIEISVCDFRAPLVFTTQCCLTGKTLADVDNWCNITLLNKQVTAFIINELSFCSWMARLK